MSKRMPWQGKPNRPDIYKLKLVVFQHFHLSCIKPEGQPPLEDKRIAKNEDRCHTCVPRVATIHTVFGTVVVWGGCFDGSQLGSNIAGEVY